MSKYNFPISDVFSVESLLELNAVKTFLEHNMKLKLLEKYDSDRYHLKELKENGLASVQGRSKATVQLIKYIKENTKNSI